MTASRQIRTPGRPHRHPTRICLNMIVRDEFPVIARLLRSVADVIDYFVIVDTGSTDDTPAQIETLANELGIDGEIHFRTWRDFGHNRQEALELAVAAQGGDWLLFIDADEELAFRDTGFLSRLETGVSYRLAKHHDELRYWLPNLVDVRENRWAWHGPVHEYLEHLSGPGRQQALDEPWIIYHAGQGCRSRGVSPREKFLRDAAVLEAALARDPDDARNRFYLAQSLRDAGELQQAFEQYGLRATMGGWEEEVHVALCEKARLAILLGHDDTQILSLHLQAWRQRPTRAEALHQLARYCRERQRYAEGYLFARTGIDIPQPPDRLFVRSDIYRWRLLDEYAICAYWIGRYGEAAQAGKRLLEEAQHPPAEAERLRRNLDFALARLA